MALPPSVLTVSQLNRFIKSLFDGEKRLKSILLTGEISNFTFHSSGHLYFSLKDQDSVIKGVMFRSYAQSLGFLPENGMRVMVTGDVVVYEKGGMYQICVYDMHPDGVGALAVQFEKLKQRLEQEGLFDPSHKKKIPDFPRRIAVVTSDTGAALRDILDITARRDPMAEILLCPVLVQGKDAPASMISALESLSSLRDRVDVVILGRGGGSMEDLWAFNSEALAYAIYRLPIPLISAVGHETDFTIADFVADLRAPTPSAAAELVTPDLSQVLAYFQGTQERIRRKVCQKLDFAQKQLLGLKNRTIFKSPESFLKLRKLSLERSAELLRGNAAAYLSGQTKRLDMVSQRLRLLNPWNVLSRGYSVLKKDNHVIHSVNQLQISDRAILWLSDGQAEVQVLSLKEESKRGNGDKETGAENHEV